MELVRYMKRHKVKVATCEIKKGFYRNIELGKDVVVCRSAKDGNW